MDYKPLHITKSQLAIVLIAVFSILFIYLIRWNGLSGQNYRSIIKSDGIGYYNYIPSILQGNINKQEVNTTFLIRTNNDRVVNKYFIGTAIVISPFVLPVYIYQKQKRIPIIFSSEYYQKAISIAALFYLLIGLVAFRKLLILYNIEGRIIAFVIFAIFAGTNLSYYTLLEPSMSHVYSFSFISIFLFLIKKISIEPTPKHTIILAVLLGLIIIIRPINFIIILSIPFIINGNIKNFLNSIIKNKKSFLISFLVFFGILFLQSYIWHLQTGKFIIWSYSNEGFYFTKPQIINFLFSFRKGFFIYTPITLLAILLFLITFRKNKKQLLNLLLFFIPIVYLLSSWWNWYYGDSYGSRVMIEFLSLFILLFALSLSKLSTRWQQSSVIIASLFIVLNIFQTYQYYYQILSYFDMNTEKYIYTFGKFGEENRQILGGNNDIIQYHTSGTSIILKDYKLSNNHKPGYYHNLEVLLSGKQLANYSSSYLQLSCKTEIIQNVLSKVNWQISYTDSLKNVITSTYFKINEIPLIPGESRFNNYAIRLPKPIFASDNYIIKISNTTNTEFILSDIKITLKGIK